MKYVHFGYVRFARLAVTAYLFLVVCISGISGCRSASQTGTELGDSSQSTSPSPKKAPSEASLASMAAAPPIYRELIWTFNDTGLGPTSVHITVPVAASKANPLPVLIALHGQGEARKSPEEGALGWPSDYGMLAAFKRLHQPPLSKTDFGDMVDAPRLATLNQDLLHHPFRGVIVVSPYIPDRFGKYLRQDAQIYGAFLTDVLLPKIRRELPANPSVSATAIDGVSLGGRAAVYIGLMHAEHFGAVGGIQTAIGNKQVPQIVRMLESVRAQHPNLAFRILTSEKDVYKKVNRTLSRGLQDAGLPHQFYVAAGNHSYEFNRGPGVYEMLLYHDRILRGEPFLGDGPF